MKAEGFGEVLPVNDFRFPTKALERIPPERRGPFKPERIARRRVPEPAEGPQSPRVEPVPSEAVKP